MSRKIEGENFASILSKRPHFYSPAGSTERNDYEIQIDKKGHKILKCVGSHDIYEEIQSYAEDCKIENIIARAAAGDPNAMNQRTGFYADVTGMPNNLAEAQNEILKLNTYFNELPAETRAKFDNSVEVFINQYGTDQWLTGMGYVKSEEQEFVPGTKEASKPLTPDTEGAKNE